MFEHASVAGPVAGVMTSVLWTLTSILFTAGGRRLGSTIVNATRIFLAVIFLGLIYRFFFSETGGWIPEINRGQLILLALSGVIGLSIGDQALFTAFVDIGPRLSTLLMTTAPIFATLFGLVVLGERIGLVGWTGMLLTLAGVAWVIRDRAPQANRPRSPHLVRGVILAIVGSACQAGGLLLSKAGMGHGWMEPGAHLDPQAATLVRMTFAAIGVIPILVLWRLRLRRAHAAPSRRIGSPRAGLGFTVMGTVFGPVLGVWMSLVAADMSSVGIAQTLMSLTPIFILPYSALVDGERITWRAVTGAVVAVSGVAILFIA